ncbi:MAG: metal ABC transporter permease, partial [Rhizobiales bacterium]|nr:metal ABC transporter permease [Hyphomicrobiales bacterium]
MLYDLVLAPFADFGFMRRALVGVIALALGAGPIGIFLMLRRMSLMGDAMAHAILPGAAIGYLLGGLSLGFMTAGGLVAGFAVALLAGALARVTVLREDATLASFYLLSLAGGVVLLSVKGSNLDLLHVLFGSVLALDDATLVLLVSASSISLIVLALIFRPLVLECVDPVFLASVNGHGGRVHLMFLG